MKKKLWKFRVQCPQAFHGRIKAALLTWPLGAPDLALVPPSGSPLTPCFMLCTVATQSPWSLLLLCHFLPMWVCSLRSLCVEWPCRLPGSSSMSRQVFPELPEGQEPLLRAGQLALLGIPVASALSTLSPRPVSRTVPRWTVNCQQLKGATNSLVLFNPHPEVVL